jgi:hypothetical protein
LYDDDAGSFFWPTFVLALITSVIGSQAMISCAFATMSHLQALNCFPRVKILHTSRRYSGQLYVPEVNFFLCISACVVTLSFRTTGFIAKAHGKKSKSLNASFYISARSKSLSTLKNIAQKFAPFYSRYLLCFYPSKQKFVWSL